MGTLYILLGNKEISYQLYHNRRILAEDTRTDEASGYLSLQELPKEWDFEKHKGDVVFISAQNHFNLMPESYTQHELAADIIRANAPIVPEREEIMLSINKTYGLQFYYSIPKALYHNLKNRFSSISFNFSGDQLLKQIKPFGRPQTVIHLRKTHCEFFILNQKRVLLYNSICSQNEVDFLYFILFSIQKLGYSLSSMQYTIAGNAEAHDTFISELRKIAPSVKIIPEPASQKLFIFN